MNWREEGERKRKRKGKGKGKGKGEGEGGGEEGGEGESRRIGVRGERDGKMRTIKKWTNYF